MNWIFLLIILCFLKQILFLLSLPLISFIVSIKKKKERKKERKIINKNAVEESNIAITGKNSIKRKVSRYINGYLRYMDIQTGLIPSHHIRNFIYRQIWKADLKKNVVIYYGAEIRSSYNLSVGDGSIIGDKVILDARRGGIKIGKNVNVGSGVSFWTGQHDYNDPYFRSMPYKRGPIKVEDRAWIGPGVIILHDVTIGEGAVIAAGAVVTKNVSPYTLVGGVPAKPIAQRNKDLRYIFTGDYLPFY